MVPSSRIRRGGAKLSVCPQPAIRSYFEQFGSEQASKTTVFRHNISNCESALYVFGPILGHWTYSIIWQTTGVRNDHQVSKVRQTTFSLATYRRTQEPRQYISLHSLHAGVYMNCVCVCVCVCVCARVCKCVYVWMYCAQAYMRISLKYYSLVPILETIFKKVVTKAWFICKHLLSWLQSRWWLDRLTILFSVIIMLYKIMCLFNILIASRFLNKAFNLSKFAACIYVKACAIQNKIYRIILLARDPVPLTPMLPL